MFSHMQKAGFLMTQLNLSHVMYMYTQEKKEGRNLVFESMQSDKHFYGLKGVGAP